MESLSDMVEVVKVPILFQIKYIKIPLPIKLNIVIISIIVYNSIFYAQIYKYKLL